MENVGFSFRKQLALSRILSLYACQSSYLRTFLWTYPFAQLALSGILSLYACQSSYLGTFLWTYPFALKVDLSELARAKSKFVFVKRSLLLVLSSFVLLHQESTETRVETCFCFCTKGNLIILKILEMSLVLYMNFALVTLKLSSSVLQFFFGQESSTSANLELSNLSMLYLKSSTFFFFFYRI